MPLTRAIAATVVQIVATDAECKRRIDDGFFSLFGTHAGAARNLAFCIANLATLHKCEPNEQQKQEVCYGIAEATVEAINKVTVAKSKPGKLASVRFAMQISRNVGQSGEHYATKLILNYQSMTNKNIDDCVFDWWSTLKADDPLIFSSAADFTKASGGVPFSQFAISA
jgi:hypothetical protein